MIELALGVDVAVLLVVVVQDLMQRAEDELHVRRIGRVHVQELHRRRAAAQVVVEHGRRAELDERLRVRVALGVRVTDLEVQGPVIGQRVLRVEVDRARVRRSEAVDRVVHGAEVRGAVVQRGDAARHRGVALNHRRW